MTKPTLDKKITLRLIKQNLRALERKLTRTRNRIGGPDDTIFVTSEIAGLEETLALFRAMHNFIVENYS